MLEIKVIDPDETKWATPIVFTSKKDDSIRFCVDYWKLNAVTLRDLNPIPWMNKSIDSLGDALVFSTPDASHSYQQVELDDADRNKAAPTSHRGLYRFSCTPFRLRNAPEAFQQTMYVITLAVKWQLDLV